VSSTTDPEELLTIGEISRRSGAAISAIHFYESKKLIHSTRDGRNQRRFSRRELRILAFIKVAQRLGFSLDEIKRAFRDLPSHRVPTKADWQKISRAWDRTLKEKIELATKARNQLNLCIGCGCLSLKDCPLRNPGDELARLGPGPRLL
jgi:MerR family redox-sensitive transcriptional activator SoxR